MTPGVMEAPDVTKPEHNTCGVYVRSETGDSVLLILSMLLTQPQSNFPLKTSHPSTSKAAAASSHTTEVHSSALLSFYNSAPERASSRDPALSDNVTHAQFF